MPKPTAPKPGPGAAGSAPKDAVVCEPGRHIGCLHERMRQRKAGGG